MLVLLLAGALAAGPPDAPEPGIAETLARERADVISQLRYELSFTVPKERTARVEGRGIIRLVLKAPHRIVLDFANAADRIR
jgi:hypothetical protein